MIRSSGGSGRVEATDSESLRASGQMRAWAGAIRLQPSQAEPCRSLSRWSANQRGLATGVEDDWQIIETITMGCATVKGAGLQQRPVQAWGMLCDCLTRERARARVGEIDRQRDRQRDRQTDRDRQIEIDR